jgi:PAS domain S-box-containing protein
MARADWSDKTSDRLRFLMVKGIDLFFALFQNMAIFIALVAVYSHLFAHLDQSRWFKRQIVMGLSFGFFAIVGMYVRIPVFEGVIVDQRNAIVALSGTFGGPLSAVTSAAMAGAFRLYLGGDGVIGGVVGVTLAAIAGIGMNILSGRFNSVRTAAVSAFLAAIVILPGFVFIKGRDIQTGLELLKAMTVPYGSAIFLGILLGGLLIRREEKRYRVELLFRESEEKYRRLFNNMNEFMVVNELLYDSNHEAVDWRMVDANPAYLTKMGRSREEIAGGCGADLCGRTAQSCLNRFAPVVRTGKPARFEEYLDTLQIHAYVSAFHLGGNRFATIISDISERKRMEAELRKSRDELEVRVRERTSELEHQKQTLQTIIDNIPVFITFYKATGEILLLNNEFEQMTGWSHEDTKHADVMAECYPDPKERGEAWEHMRKPCPAWKDMRMRTRDGRYLDTRWMNVRVGEGLHIGIGLDVTEQLYLDHQLRQAQKMQAVGTLAGGIAHDFNNMLAVIIGNAEIALDDIGDRVPHRNIEQILQASMRSRSLVKQILTFSRKSEGKREWLHLIPIVEETTRLLRGSLPSTIRIELNLKSHSDTILADPSQIQQVLMNLSTNAAHAMRENGGLLTIGLADAAYGEGEPLPDPRMMPGRYVVLTVSDTGIGMSEETRSRIFEPFFTTKAPGQGTGMGLSVVFGVVDSHNGTILVDSKVAEGSTFRIFLPAFEGVIEEERDEEDEFPKGKGNILIVDDEPSVLGMVSESLKRLGYATTTAGGGPEGWRTFTASPGNFDLVVTDQVMPELTGMRLAEKMLEIRNDLPIILFTGYGEAVSPEKVHAAGISGFLMKPVQRRELAETVRRVMDKEDRGRAKAG